MHERRHFTRVPFIDKVYLLLEESSQNVEILDVSLQGALIQVSGNVSSDPVESCRLEMVLSEEIKIQAECRKVFCDEASCHWGLQFEKMDIDSLTHLRRLLEVNVGDSEQISKELDFLKYSKK